MDLNHIMDELDKTDQRREHWSISLSYVDETDKQNVDAFHISVHMEAKFWEMAYQHQTWKERFNSL